MKKTSSLLKSPRPNRRGASIGTIGSIALAISILATRNAPAQGQSQPFEFSDGERVVLIGNTLAERFVYFGWLETRLQLAHPDKHLSIRNLGWSGDEVALMPRPLDFGSLEDHLAAQKADTILLFFGANESFAGAAGVEKYGRDLRALCENLRSRKFNEKSAPRLVLLSPIAHEQLGPPWPDAGDRNVELERYTDATRRAAEALDLVFIDLFHPTRTLMAENGTGKPLTINGIHLTDDGCRAVSEIIAAGLGITDPLPGDVSSIRSLVMEKNRQFFLRWRPVNAEYVFGRRKEPFGVITFPPEMEQLDKQIAELDGKIQAAAAKLSAPKP
ncbi:MAG: SGNH/GDSL hydrolase family protein [Akkermansiaceae bacterium]|nr:SGNH/GDSL hydrolase family protein [Akkermansiaceae bacterium]